MKQIIRALIIALGLAGCSAHNPLIIRNTNDINQVGATNYSPHSNRVFVTSISFSKYHYVIR
jgi:hypothetical protein